VDAKTWRLKTASVTNGHWAHGQLEFQVRAWLLALLGALVAPSFPFTRLSRSISYCGFVVDLTFVLMELVVRIPTQGDYRAFVVEEMLRSYQSYDGPKISSRYLHNG